MFNGAPNRTVQERMRCGFGRVSQAVVHTEDPYSCWEHDDPFTPIIISQNSELTVCSGITLDEALETSQPMETQSEQTDPLYIDHGSRNSALPFDHHVMTTAHNIQNENARGCPVVHMIPDNDKERWNGAMVEERKPPIANPSTETTVESFEERDCLELWPTLIEEEKEEEMEEESTPSAKLANHKQRNVSVTLKDFDFDHLTIFQDSVFDEEESCEDSEAWIVKKLEQNASQLYWLQLTTEITNTTCLIQAMYGNTAVRNVTVYPSALHSLPVVKQKLLVDAICQLQNLRNLIVFQDCGSLFVDPLIRYRPPLAKLTLYKLDFAVGNNLPRLAILLLGLPGLEELSLEKYRGVDGAKLLKVFSTVLPSLSGLQNVSMTPARGVKLSIDGPHALFRALGQNNTVRKLSLEGSEEGIDQACVNELKHALHVNTTLQEVKLTGFWKNEDSFWRQFKEKTTAKINFLLEMNKTGIRDLQLDVTADFETLRNAIASHRDNLDCIFYLLQHNPSMVRA